MKAMVLRQVVNLADEPAPLTLEDLPVPEPAPGELLIHVEVCGVCHTEIDEIEGRTVSSLPVVPGHQVVGTVAEAGDRFSSGDRVGVGWIFSACGTCEYCRAGNENLCSEFLATGRDRNGGYAEYMTIPEDFACSIPPSLAAVDTAPLLCAGAIGYRSLRLTEIRDGQNLGLTGFGASAHLVLKMVRHLYPDIRVYVFARSERERQFAMELGAVWSGDTTDTPPDLLHAIIDTTPVWKPIVAALGHLVPGGRLVINAIRKEDPDKRIMEELDYTRHLWMEKEIKSVANVARRDIEEFLKLAAETDSTPEVQQCPLSEANVALQELKRGNIKGAKVLIVG
ncbi:MAG: zinc-dependent alcohol dehydrogenase family protein [Pseudomonadales bacterium]|nr:zinc-dependent alcohol dehydrogenase family protein [Pseudomonadales bacterium]